MSFLQELKRRNVLRVGLAYLVASWLLLQVLDVIGEILQLPDQLARYVLFLLAAGFLPALIIAWVYELTPDGLKLESEISSEQSITPRTGRKLDRAIMVSLALAVALLLFDKLALREPESIASPRAESQSLQAVSPTTTEHSNVDKSVAVLPFVAMSNGPDDNYFADGLTEEIINSLTQLPDLLVTARTSAFHFKDRNEPIGEIASQLGVAHVVEGSVRRAGERLRITAQLIRAQDGFHLWSETYDRNTQDTLAVQTDIAEQVAQALNVFLDENSRMRMQRSQTKNVDAFIAFQKGVELYERAHSEVNQISLLRRANGMFEQATRLEPTFYQAYEFHTDLYSHILLSHAAGRIDGEITDQDVAEAPNALALDYKMSIRHAPTQADRINSQFGRELALGSWKGLRQLSLAAAAPPGCETAVWLHLAGTAFGQAQQVFDSFSRLYTCDPLRHRARVHQVGSSLWMGNTQQVIEFVQLRLQLYYHPYLVRHLSLALAYQGDFQQAELVNRSRSNAPHEARQTQAMISAIQGNAEQSQQYLDDYLVQVGPDDRTSLIIAAMSGQRNEANRLASLIDRRTFGHMVLLQVIFSCMCGAPFDLEATPNFSKKFKVSEYEWPPGRPFQYPLKDW